MNEEGARNMELNEMIDFVRKTTKRINNYIDVVLIAHVLQPRGHDNQKQINCALTEHLTLDEFNDIYRGIVNAGFFVREVFFNELELVCDMVKNCDAYRNSIVFNLARNGLAHNKKAVIPSVCELLRIAYTSSDSFSSSLARNKLMFGRLLKGQGISVPNAWTAEELLAVENSLPTNYKLIKKPISDSASQGINRNSIFTSREAIIYCKKHSKPADIFFQQFIEGYECEVPIIRIFDNIYIFPPVGISINGAAGNAEIVTYQISLDNAYSFFPLENMLPLDCCAQIKEISINTFSLLGMQHYGRVDFRIDSKLNPYIIDISTTPYITTHSSFAYAFKQMGLEYEDIFRCIITSAVNELERYNEKN